MLYKFSCGHVGRDSEPPLKHERAKTTAFIRVAEIRKERVEEVAKSCPDCKTGAAR